MRSHAATMFLVSAQLQFRQDWEPVIVHSSLISVGSLCKIDGIKGNFSENIFSVQWTQYIL